VLAEAEPLSQREHDLDIRPRLTARRNHRPPQLNQGLCLLADLESDPQGLDLERGRHRKDDVGEVRRHATRAIVLADGELLFDGLPRELIAPSESGEDDFEEAFVAFLKAHGH
jgi:hypothetical protein